MSQSKTIESKLNSKTLTVYLPELFRVVSQEHSRERKIELLRKYRDKDSIHLRVIRDYLQALYHPKVKLDLPDEIPPYDCSGILDYNCAPMSMFNALTKVKRFVKGQSDYIEDVPRREMFFVKILEGMFKSDAELFASLLLKKFPSDIYPGIDKTIFKEAFPEYFEFENDTQ